MTRRLVILAAVFLLLLILVVLFLRSRSRVYREAVIDWTAETEAGALSDYLLFDGQLLRASPGGLALFDSRGRQVWNAGFSMENPRVALQGTYGAAADLLGKTAVIFGKKGVTGTVSTIYPIQNLTVSSHGVLALVLDQGSSTRIQFYDREGKELDISVSLNMAVSGYPLSLALSPEGTSLVVAAVSSTSGALKTQLVFYNFSAGKGVSNRMVGYFEYVGTVFPQLAFLSGSRVAAVGDDRVVFISLENETRPEMLREIELDARLTLLDAGSGLLSLVLPAVGGGQSRIQVYGADGRLRFQKELDDHCCCVRNTADYCLMVTEKGICLWDHQGKERFSGPLTYSAQTVFALDNKTLIQCGGSLICGYTLH